MTHAYDGYNYLVRLEKGEALIEQLTNFVREKDIKGGWISGIGGALRAELGFYDLQAKQYQWKKIEQLLEITTLQGSVAWNDNEPVLHLHGTFSSSDMQAIGGHIKELNVSGTCELFIHVWNGDRLTRSPDSNIGLNLLDL